MDGTAKGGVILAIVRELRLPVRYVGVGETADDLLDFDPEAFARALVDD
jgi:fused signal recognition particle receptor